MLGKEGAVARRIREYKAEKINITYDIKRCIHARECVRRLPRVFDPDRRPWIDPSHGSADEISEVVTRCPTGALHFERLDGGWPESPPAANVVTLAPDGPLYVKGNLELHARQSVTTETRAALCRCGASHYKPFCDNTHLDIEFKDAGSFEAEHSHEVRPGQATGKLVISPQANGPFFLQGDLELRSGDGQRSMLCREGSWFCRCGQSRNRPFCDGSHAKAGFVAE